MEALLKHFLYIHALFSVMLYLVGSFITVVILEYKLKNVNLKHTLAGFACVALSGFVAYFIPVYFFGNRPLFYMQMVGVLSALALQAAFWWFWFRDRLKPFIPALALAFALTVVVAMIGYNIFVWYIGVVIKGVAKEVAKGAAATGAVMSFF